MPKAVYGVKRNSIADFLEDHDPISVWRATSCEPCSRLLSDFGVLDRDANDARSVAGRLLRPTLAIKVYTDTHTISETTCRRFRVCSTFRKIQPKITLY